MEFFVPYVWTLVLQWNTKVVIYGRGRNFFLGAKGVDFWAQKERDFWAQKERDYWAQKERDFWAQKKSISGRKKAISGR